VTPRSTFATWPVRYRSWQLEVFESNGHQLWLGVADLRRVVPGMRRDAALLLDYPSGVTQLDQSKRLFLNERTVRAELQRNRGHETLLFLTWFEKTLVYPAERKRENLSAATSGTVRPSSGKQGADVSLQAAPMPRGLLGRIWCGEVDLRKTFVAGGLLVLACVVVIGWFVQSLANPVHYEGDFLQRQWLIALFILLSTTAPVWWCVGLMRCALRYQRTHRSVLLAFMAFVSAASLLLLSVTTTLSASGEWLAGALDTLRNKDAVVEVIHDPVLGRLVLRGEIGFGSYKVLKKALALEPRLTPIEVESPGGYVIEGLAMARLIQQYGLDTVSLERCASACTLLLAAGNDRYIGPQARVGFHRSSGAWTKPGKEWSATDFQMADYYLARGSSQEFVAQALDTPPADLWVPDPMLLVAAGYASKLWEERKAGY